MGFFDDIVEGIGSVAGGAIGGIASGIGSIFNNERNIGYQREAQDYAKWLNSMTWQREDTAVQRRVADLKAAGLSPVLAAGSSAQTGSPIKIDPANASENVGEAVMSGMTRAAQTQQSLMASKAAAAQVTMLEAQAQKAVTENKFLKHELKIFQATGKNPRVAGGFFGDVRDAVALWDSQVGKNIRDAASDMYHRNMDKLPEVLQTEDHKAYKARQPGFFRQGFYGEKYGSVK